MTAELAKGVSFGLLTDDLDSIGIAKGVAFALVALPIEGDEFVFAVLEFITDADVVSNNVMTDADVVTLQEF